jgi:uncharacterized membrane protein YphA (DoxX/SURF4 family)
MSAMYSFTTPNLPSLLLRVALAFVFSFAAVSSLLSPNDWIGYLPKAATQFVSGDILLKVMSVYELALAAWLLSGKQTHFAALLSAATLAGITAANISLIAISFRDIGLIFAALALAALSFAQSKGQS